MANNFLISGQNASGSGNGGPVEVHWSNVAYVIVESSGNSASATIWGDAGDEGRWMPVTSFAVGVNSTATAQITSFFQRVMATDVWNSGGTNTGTLYLQYAPRRLTWY